MRIEIVYPLATSQEIIVLELAAGTSVGEAVLASGLAGGGLQLGIGGRQVAASHPLRDGDRVELLRPLAMDPKEQRRRRARAAKRR